MPSVTVIGARGYTGSELLPLLWRHPEFELAAVGSRSAAGQRVAESTPGLEGCDLLYSDINPDSLSEYPADAFILALPNGEAGDYVAAIDAACPDAVVVDLSADYRFDDRWTYGQPERFGDRIQGATRIANPGCYATGMQLAIAPISERLAATPSAFGVSGFSGAGRSRSRKNDPEALRDNLMPYSLAGHVHEREVTRHLGHPVRFLPHVAAFFRGISLTVSAELSAPLSAEDLHGLYEQAWTGCDLISVKDGIPEVAEIQGRHGVVIGGFTVSETAPGSIALVCVLDNLLKGAATQAVQNLNIACGYDGLTGIPQ
ncbi:MAG: N-acetyl-gamma-glutamyl-phosphate reductase [Xanthomonadales bacterium]|nr:N-acetyl-gamma-glutamyl-phosphate reductase [Xanthomonadales bacterium]